MNEIEEIVHIMETGFQGGRSKKEIANSILDMVLARRGLNQMPRRERETKTQTNDLQ